jgi:Bacterial Ig-like domain (group 3)
VHQLVCRKEFTVWLFLVCLISPHFLFASRHGGDLPSSQNGGCTSLATQGCQGGNGSFPYVAAYPPITLPPGSNFSVTVSPYIWGGVTLNSNSDGYTGATASYTAINIALTSTNPNVRLVAVAVAANMTGAGYVTPPASGFILALPSTPDLGSSSLSLSDPISEVDSGYTLWALGSSSPKQVVLLANGVPNTTSNITQLDPTDQAVTPTLSAANGITAPSDSATYAVVVFNGTGYEVVGGLPLKGEPVPCGSTNGTPTVTCHDFTSLVNVDLSTGNFSDLTRVDEAPTPSPYTTDSLDASGNDTATCGSPSLAFDSLNLRAGYSYTPSTDQTINISTAGSHYQTVIDVTDGTTVTCSDMSADGTAFQAEIDGFKLKSGTQYSIYVGDYPPLAPSFSSTCDTQDTNGNTLPCPLTSDPVLNFSLSVQPETTAMTLSCSPQSSVTGTQVTCTANVTDTGNTTNVPTGNVQFTFTTVSGSTPAETLTTTLSNGGAAATTSNLVAGSYTVTATLQPSTSQFIPSSGTASLTVTNPAPISTSVAASASQGTVAAGSGYTISATLNKSSGTAAPTGTLILFDGTTQAGSQPVSTSAAASFAVTNATAGTHSYTVQYSGDTVYATSTSTAVQVTVNKDTSKTALSSSAASVNMNGSVTLTATISNTSATSLSPTGTVTFLNGSTTIGTAALSNGVAVLTTSAVAATAGSYTLTAQYGGDGNFNPSSGTASLTVTNPAPISTSVAASASQGTVAAGSGYTISATLNKSSGTAAPTGTLILFDGTTQAGSQPVSTSAAASFAVTNATAGTHSYTVQYSGDTVYATSTSAAFQVTVNKDTSKTALSSSAASVNMNGSVTLTATISATSATSLSPTGTVTFLNGSTTIGTAALSNGVAALTTSAVAATAGSYTLTAQYGGDGNFNSSVSSALTLTVIAPSFSLSSSSSSLSVTPTQSGAATIGLIASGGYNQAVTFSCSGLPAGVSCSFNPASVTPDAAGDPTSTALTVSTTSATAHVLFSNGAARFGLSLAGCLPLLLFRRRKELPHRKSPMRILRVGFVGLIFASALLAACGAGGHTADSAPQPTTTSYTVTIDGTPGAGSTAVSQSTSIQVAVTN